MKQSTKALLGAGAAIVLILALVSLANAQNAKRNLQLLGQKKALGGMFRPRAALQGLNLTQQQKEQVKSILANHKDEVKAAAKDFVQARAVLGAALAGGASDDVLKATFDKMSGAEWNVVLLRSRISAEIKPILTPDQQALLQQRMSKLGTRIQKLIKRLE